MSEKTTFRERRTEVCREKLGSRKEAVELIARFIYNRNTVQTVKFEHPRRTKKTVMIGLFFQPNDADPNATPTRQDWQQNPRYVISLFLNDILKIFQDTDSQALKETAAQCIARYGSEYPNLIFDIYMINAILKIIKMAEEICFMETIEKQKTIIILIKSLQRSVTEKVRASFRPA